METKRYEAFGWKIDKTIMKAGDIFEGIVPEDTPREDIVNNTLYTKGRITGVSSVEGVKVLTRTPGFFNTDLPEIIKAQTATFTAEEDSEFWCLNYNVNGRKEPVLSVLSLQANEVRELPAYLKILICKGNLNINGLILSEGNSISLSSDTTVTTDEQTYCLLIT